MLSLRYCRCVNLRTVSTRLLDLAMETPVSVYGQGNASLSVRPSA